MKALVLAMVKSIAFLLTEKAKQHPSSQAAATAKGLSDELNAALDAVEMPDEDSGIRPAGSQTAGPVSIDDFKESDPIKTGNAEYDAGLTNAHD